MEREKKTQLSSLPAIHFSETMGPQLPRPYSRFYCTLQIGIYVTTAAFNWEIIKKAWANSEFFTQKLLSMFSLNETILPFLFLCPASSHIQKVNQDRALIDWSSPNLSDLENTFSKIAITFLLCYYLLNILLQSPNF